MKQAKCENNTISHKKSEIKEITDESREVIDYLNHLKNGYSKENQYQAKNVKYRGVETIKYLFNDEDEDYSIYLIKNQQYQSFSDKMFLPINEYLGKIRPAMIKIIKHFETSLFVNAVFKSIRSPNDKRTVHIKNKDTTDIDKIFNELIKEHRDLTESLRNFDLIPKEIESIDYSFTEIIIKNTFIETPEWIKDKKCTINP